MVKPPIILVDGLDVSFHPTCEATALQVEDVDVRNGIYTVFDSEGHVLQFSLTPEEGITLRLPRDEIKNEEELLNILCEYILHFEPDIRCQGMPLDRVVQLANEINIKNYKSLLTRLKRFIVDFIR